MSTTDPKDQQIKFSSAEMGVLAHLYRGEMYRSKVWRTRLDTTTNWAVATTGIALSVTFSNPQNSPLPLILIDLLVLVFLIIEGRRYRYFDIWRTRVRLLEVGFYVPLLKGKGIKTDDGWNEALARDISHLHFHISYLEAAGRRLRRNYGWIFAVLGISYIAKIIIHPVHLQSMDELFARAAVGPVPGIVVLLTGALFNAGLLFVALFTLRSQEAAGRVRALGGYDDPMRKLTRRREGLD